MSIQVAKPPLIPGDADYTSIRLGQTSTIQVETITGLAPPVNETDATNKFYVDTLIAAVPAPPAQSIQFNSNPAGHLTGSAKFIFDNTTNTIDLDGNINLTNAASIIDFTQDTGIITGLVNPINPLDAANKQYVDSAVSNAPGLPFNSLQYNDGGILGGSTNLLYNGTDEISFPMNTGIITGLATPINPLDATNKAYVDSQVGNVPGAPNESIQFNNSGSFEGTSDLLYNSGTAELSLNNASSQINFTMSTGIVTGLATPVSASDAANKAYVDSQVGNVPGAPNESLQFNNSGSFGGTSDLLYNSGTAELSLNNASSQINFTMSTGIVTGLATPVNALDAANKAYVDAVSTPPGAPNESIQFNNSGSFGGTTDLVYNSGTQTITLNGNIDLDSNTSVITFTQSTGIISGLATPVSASDAANKAYVDAVSTPPGAPNESIQFNNSGSFGGTSDLLYNSGTAELSLNNASSQINFTQSTGIVTGLSNPINPLDAANKSYVDSAITLSPGLPFNSLQFNSSGILGGSSNLLWNSGTSTITLDGIFQNTGTTNSTSSTTGSIITAGGVGISLDTYIGGTCYALDFLTTSDEKLKSEIEKIDGSEVEKLDLISGYSYFIDDDNLRYGFLAGELERSGLDNLVKNIDNHKKISYQSFIPLMLEKMKIMENRIKALELIQNNNLLDC